MRPHRTIKTRNSPIGGSIMGCWPALGFQNSKDGKTFRPVFVWRVLYILMLTAGLGAVICDAIGIWHSKLLPPEDDWIALAALVALPLFAAVTWPPTVLAAPEGSHGRRLLIRRLIPWDQIEAAYTAHAESSWGEGGGYGLGLYIFVKRGKRYDLNDFIMGRAQLKALIKKKLIEIRGSKVVVR